MYIVAARHPKKPIALHGCKAFRYETVWTILEMAPIRNTLMAMNALGFVKT